MRAAAILWVLVGTACALPEVRSHVRGRGDGNPGRRLTDAWQDKKIESLWPFSVVSGNVLAVTDAVDADTDDPQFKINIYRFDYTQQQWVDEKTPKILTYSWCGMALSGETLAVGECDGESIDEDPVGTVSIYQLPDSLRDWQLVKQFSICPSFMSPLLTTTYFSSSPVALHGDVLAVCGNDGNLYVSRYDKSTWLEPEIISEFECLSSVVSGNAVAVTDGDYTVKVFRYADGGWKEETEITVPRVGPAGLGKTHPLAIAMSGDLLAVGASGTNTEFYEKDFEDAAGVTYIYQYSGNTSTWLELGSPLQASDATPKDSFGYAVSFSGKAPGKHLAIGAPQFRFPGKGEDGRPGKVYIFYPGGGGTSDSWTQGRVLQPEDGARNDFFGKFISATDRNIAVGAFCPWPENPCTTWPTYIYNLPCPPGRIGEDCELEECALTAGVVSLGYLTLEAQWPRPARVTSPNEAFLGINAALRTFDTNGDDYLNVTEARNAIAAGGMAVPKDVVHIWSHDNGDGTFQKVYQNSITITRMTSDTLTQLAKQGTTEFYYRPDGSGEIKDMNATYPNNDWGNEECMRQEERPPLLEWVVDRGDNIIFEQCAFFNGERIPNLQVASGKSNVDPGADCSKTGSDTVCKYDFQFSSTYEVRSYHQGGGGGILLNISKHSYCVQTKFCPAGTLDCTSSTVPMQTVTRCTAGLQFDGTPADVYARMENREGVLISWLATSPRVTVYRIFKTTVEGSPQLLREEVLTAAKCGLTISPDSFHDTSTGAKPGINVGYEVIPLNETTGEGRAGRSGFLVPWVGHLHVSVVAKGGGPVKGVTVKLSHLLNNQLDPEYTYFTKSDTDANGDATLQINVQDRNWVKLTQHFVVKVEYSTVLTDNKSWITHEFQPPTTETTVRHLGESTLQFIDETAVSISGTVSHAGFNASWFIDDCPNTKTDGTCMCPVESVEVFIKDSSGTEQNVSLNEGKFSVAVSRGERVTLGLRRYDGNGVVPHTFSVTHNMTTDTVVVRTGIEPEFTYTATEHAEVNLLDISTQGLSASLVGASRAPAKYVSGLPVVASVARCGWEQPAWTVRGVADFVLGAAEKVDVRVLGPDEVEEAKFYYPPGGSGDVEACSAITRDDIIVPVSNPPEFTRGCRAEIPKVEMCDQVKVEGCQTKKRTCATSGYTYVDEIPAVRSFERDLSILATNATNATNTTAPTASPVEFVIASRLCLKSVSVAAANGTTTLQSLLASSGSREYELASEENLLLHPPKPTHEPQPYGEACTTDTDAVFRVDDQVSFRFTLVEREPNCVESAVYPWDKKNGCNRGYTETSPSPDHPIAVRVADDVSGTAGSPTCDAGSFSHVMIPAECNPFAPFSKELTVTIDRAFDRAKVEYVRHVLIVGSIAEEVPQVWTTSVKNVIFSIIHDPPGGESTATLVEGSTISRSIAIDGAHAATLQKSKNRGDSGGASANIAISEAFMGIGPITNLVATGTTNGGSQSFSPSVTVDKGSSRHFDVGISFDIAISTSDSPYLAGQPSDVIIGGGAELRFIEAIEVYATETPDSDPIELCLAGRESVQFLPERITTYVMSVYEIEKTMEHLGSMLIKEEEGEMIFKGNVTGNDIQEQIENWKTVLKSYRATTNQSSVHSIAAKLGEVVQGLTHDFNTFLAKDDSPTVARSMNILKQAKDSMGDLINLQRDDGNSGNKSPSVDYEKAEDDDEFEFVSYELSNANRLAETADACKMVSGSNDHTKAQQTLCDAYNDIKGNLELVNTLLGVCSFAKKACCDPRIGPTDENGDPTPETDDTCTEGSECSSVDLFCKNGTVPGIGSYSPDTVMSAFDFLTDTTKFLTFSGTTEVAFDWNIAEASGSDATVESGGSWDHSRGRDHSAGGQIGRRLAGYSYPANGPVHAVSKKLLEVPAEALAERRLIGIEGPRAAIAHAVFNRGEGKYGIKQSRKDGNSLGNPCRRRLQVGASYCHAWGVAETDSFTVSLSRSLAKETEHDHTVAVSLKDGNLQDTFAVQVAMDPFYGTPIFTTLGGRSSCVGETGTTRRDSRVTIEKIKPLCSEKSPGASAGVCASDSDCECTNLPPGQDAIFSVQLRNLSPWETSVRYLLRAVNGAATAFDEHKYAYAVNETCPDGDSGSLEIRAFGSTRPDLRDGDGIIFAPLPYGQSEVRIRVSRPDFAPQCFSYSNIQLQLVSVCEDTDWDAVEDVYQYNTRMDANGGVTVIYPEWDNNTRAFANGTTARTSDTSTKSFDVSWKKQKNSDDCTSCSPGCVCSYTDGAMVSQTCPALDSSPKDPALTPVVTGTLCVSTTSSDVAIVEAQLREKISELTFVETSYVKIAGSEGGTICPVRRLRDSSLRRSLQESLLITVSVATDGMNHANGIKKALSRLSEAMTGIMDVVFVDELEIIESCKSCTYDEDCHSDNERCDLDGGGIRKLRFGNIQNGCCRVR